MRSRNMLLTTVLTIAVVGLFATVLSTSLLPGNATAGHNLFAQLHGEQHRGRWSTNHCAQIDDRTTRLMSAYVSITLDLDEAQEAALAPVIEIVKRWHDETGNFCGHSGITTAPAALDQLDQILSGTRTVLDELRPAFDAFYGALTAEQQERLNSWISHHQPSAT